MVIGFIGAPYSGKTTTAAKAFADLKDLGAATEYVPEVARWYIAEKKTYWTGAYRRALRPEFEGLKFEGLKNEDQIRIMERQLENEAIMAASCDFDTMVITDGCALNSLLYMPESLRRCAEVSRCITQSIDQYDVLFYCAPVYDTWIPDPNRLHSHEEAKAIDCIIPGVKEMYFPGVEMITLEGKSKSRNREAVNHLLSLGITGLGRC